MTPHRAVPLAANWGEQGFLQAAECAKHIDTFLALMQKGPDGTSVQSIGQACVCWICGRVGLPANADKLTDGTYDTLPQCAGCKADDQTNLVKISFPEGGVIPWIQCAMQQPSESAEVPATTDRTAVDLAAKRAEIEARVAAARAAQAAADEVK